MPTPSERPDESAEREPSGEPQVHRPDPEDPPTGPAEELDDDFDPAAAPSNPDLVGPDPDELPDKSS